MSELTQHPPPGARLLRFTGETLEVSLQTSPGMEGRAFLRTNLGRGWRDLPMNPDPAQPGRHTLRIPLTSPGFFAFKACFTTTWDRRVLRHSWRKTVCPAADANLFMPRWTGDLRCDAAQTRLSHVTLPDGPETRVKVEPAYTVCANTIYTAFVRQFGKAVASDPYSPQNREHADALSSQGYTVIPPSGTFRGLIQKLDLILGEMRFRILQLLPIHPTPTTYGRMGEFGSPFAARDLMDVDPALAEFDTRATPMDQFRELVDAVHCRGARIFLDIPANHTGWASVLQHQHPEWFKRNPDGAFQSPGAWGVVWEDLVALDHTCHGLRDYLVEVFLFWCKQGVDGFRCDAGYMVPADVWAHITTRVREHFPDTVFLLEGLGGSIETTEKLLTEANLDWAYSEIFQTENRSDFEAYLPAAIALSERAGPLVHFAETHDNARLACRGHSYARLRTMIAAFFSHHGAFGIANGAEWFATEKIDVHEARPLNWGASQNQVQLIRHLNTLLAVHPAFAQGVALRLIHHGPGNVLALLREYEGGSLLVLANLGGHAQTVSWDAAAFPASGDCVDLLTLRPAPLVSNAMELLPMQVVCLSIQPRDIEELKTALDAPNAEPPAVLALRQNVQIFLAARGDTRPPGVNREPHSLRLEGGCPHPPHAGQVLRKYACDLSFATWDFPADTRREVMIAPGQLLVVRAPYSFRASVQSTHPEFSVLGDEGTHTAVFQITNDTTDHLPLTLHLELYENNTARHFYSPLLALAKPKHLRVKTTFSGDEVRERPYLCAILANRRGAAAYVPAAWGELHSKYNALLALNPDPRVPSDRIVFFTRCRLWLRHGDTSVAIDKNCLKSFSADPSGCQAVWHFDVPCGMGAHLPLTLTLVLDRGENRVEMKVAEGVGCDLRARRTPGNLPFFASLAARPEVAPYPFSPNAKFDFTLIIRPDMEWRSFHHVTKAHTGVEEKFSRATTLLPNGFTFAPEDGGSTESRPPSVLMEGASFHFEPEWCRDVFFSVEAQRGLEAHTDLFSPGWFEASLSPGKNVKLVAEMPTCRPADLSTGRQVDRSDCPFENLTLHDALHRALSLYIADRDDSKTVIAGFPWFLDWGRDTLIFLRGLIAAGETETALGILREFARFEERGTLPNILHGNTVGNRDTSDAPLWFIIAVRDLVAKNGKKILATDCVDRTLRDVCVSILAHYRDGTPNGIKMYADTGLVFSPAHFTWMDTNHPAATPREGYPVEIQALWIASLDFVASHDTCHDWAALAQRARESFVRLFIRPADRSAGRQVGISDMLGKPEESLRPNALFAITLGVLTDPAHTLPILDAIRPLVVPGAMRSLADAPVETPIPVYHNGQLLNDPHHPFWPRYEGDEDTRRKPAYHNGTAWVWFFPSYVEALLLVHGNAVKPLAAALLGSVTKLFNENCVGQLPEILDGAAPHTQRGCPAQAWSVSEFLRVQLLVQKNQ